MTMVVRDEVCEFDVTMQDLQKTQSLCAALMKTKHYASMGEVGIFAIVQKARALNLSPLDALNGAMYFVQGKVELTANTMNYLIRAAGHSITKDSKSDRTCCILHGKRVDNGDTWTASFSIDDAKKAGIYKNTWDKYPEDMLFCRALSRLARQLFPDVIKGCYVEGEINTPNLNEPVRYEDVKPTLQIETKNRVSESQIHELAELLEKCSPAFNDIISKRMKALNINSLSSLTLEMYENTKIMAEEDMKRYQKELVEKEMMITNVDEAVNE